MFKKIFALILLLFIVSCTSVTNYEFDYYTAICEHHEGVREAVVIPFPIDICYVVCQDGRKFRFKQE